MTQIPDSIQPYSNEVEEAVKDVLTVSDNQAEALLIDEYDKFLGLLITHLQQRKEMLQTDLKKKMADLR